MFSKREDGKTFGGLVDIKKNIAESLRTQISIAEWIYAAKD